MPIKWTTTTGGGERTKKKIPKSLQNKSEHKNSKCFSWVTALRVLSLAGTHSPPHLPRMPSNSALISGPAVQRPGSSDSNLVLLLCVLASSPQLSELVCFVLWKLSMSFYIIYRYRVCLADHVDLIFSLYSWWEGLGSSLVTLTLGFNCGFSSTSACGLSTGVCSWGCPGGLWFAPVRARCGGGAAAWVTGGSGSTRYSGIAG